MNASPLRRWPTIVLPLTVLLVAGCNPPESANPSSAKIRREVAQADAALDLPSVEECEAFARKCEQIANAGDYGFVANRFDMEAVFSRSMIGLDTSPSVHEILHEAFSNVALDRTFQEQWEKAGAAGWRFCYLRCRDVGPQRRVLFRFAAPSAGLNYFEFVLAKDDEGNIRIVDGYSMLTGELVSASGRRSMLPVVAIASKSTLDQLSRSERELIEHLPDLAKIAADVRMERFEEALERYEGLPDGLKREKNSLLVKYRAANGLRQKARQQGASKEAAESMVLDTLAEMKRQYPRDPCFELLSVDTYLLEKDFDAARFAVDRLDEIVGGDPYLDYYRGRIAAEQEEFTAAAHYYQRLLDDGIFPDDALLNLAMVAARTGDFDRTSELLEQFERDYFELTNLANSRLFQKYIQSPQYAAWLERRSKR